MASPGQVQHEHVSGRLTLSPPPTPPVQQPSVARGRARAEAHVPGAPLQQDGPGAHPPPRWTPLWKPLLAHALWPFEQGLSHAPLACAAGAPQSKGWMAEDPGATKQGDEGHTLCWEVRPTMQRARLGSQKPTVSIRCPATTQHSAPAPLSRGSFLTTMRSTRAPAPPPTVRLASLPPVPPRPLRLSVRELLIWVLAHFLQVQPVLL